MPRQLASGYRLERLSTTLNWPFCGRTSLFRQPADSALLSAQLFRRVCFPSQFNDWCTNEGLTAPGAGIRTWLYPPQTLLLPWCLGAATTLKYKHSPIGAKRGFTYSAHH